MDIVLSIFVILSFILNISKGKIKHKNFLNGNIFQSRPCILKILHSILKLIYDFLHANTFNNTLSSLETEFCFINGFLFKKKKKHI